MLSKELTIVVKTKTERKTLKFSSSSRKFPASELAINIWKICFLVMCVCVCQCLAKEEFLNHF